MNEYLIEIKNLHKYFGKNEVLKGLDIQIKKGEVVVMIGPSGSGKSTFLRTMNLLEKPTDGQVYFEGVLLINQWMSSNTEKKWGWFFNNLIYFLI